MSSSNLGLGISVRSGLTKVIHLILPSRRNPGKEHGRFISASNSSYRTGLASVTSLQMQLANSTRGTLSASCCSTFANRFRRPENFPDMRHIPLRFPSSNQS